MMKKTRIWNTTNPVVSWPCFPSGITLAWTPHTGSGQCGENSRRRLQVLDHRSGTDILKGPRGQRSPIFSRFSTVLHLSPLHSVTTDTACSDGTLQDPNSEGEELPSSFDGTGVTRGWGQPLLVWLFLSALPQPGPGCWPSCGGAERGN